MKLRFFLITYGIANAGLVIYGLLALALPGMLLDPFLRQVYRFPDEATTAVAYMAALFRLLGFLNAILGLLGLILLQRYRRSHQMWLVQIVIGVSLLSYLGPVVFDNTVGSIGVFELIEHILFGAMIVSGMIMLGQRYARA